MIVVRLQRLSCILFLTSFFVSVVLIGLVPFDRAVAVPIGEAPNAPPTILEIDPTSVPSDIEVIITITGTDFTAELTDTIVLTPPIISLGDTVLNDAGWITTTLMTATVPWNLKAGSYTLTITNPDGTVGALPHAFTVTAGFNVWNSGGPYGGDMWHVVVNPLSPTQVLGVAWWSGLFASEDRAAQWRNADYDHLLNVAQHAADPIERVKAYQLAERILIEEAMIMPLAYSQTHLLIKPWVKRDPVSPFGAFYWKDVIIEPH